EDGIRDYKVTGVQTCALPISRGTARSAASVAGRGCAYGLPRPHSIAATFGRRRSSSAGKPDSALPWWGTFIASTRGRSSGRRTRSEERRVGKEGRTLWESTDE